jgi:hypothetical protein
MDEDEEVWARIAMNTEDARRVEALSPPRSPVELIMSMETVLEQRRKIAEVSARLRSRAASWTRGNDDQPNRG